MKAGYVAAALIAAMALPSGAASAQKAEDVLKPISPWALSPAPDSCVLSRQFGEGKENLFLRMRSFAPGYDFDFTVAGPPVSTIRSARDIYISYGAGAPLPFVPLASGSLGEHGPAIIFNKDISVDQPALLTTDHAYPDAMLEASITQFTISAAKRHLVLATGPIAPVMNALRHCTDELLESWGLNSTVQAKLSNPVKPLNAEAVNALIMAGDPPEAVRRLGGIARLRLRIMVDATGTPTGCKMLPTDGVPEFEVNSCDIVMKNARYSPALDEHVQPVASYFMTSIVFATPEFFRSR
ncbi:energy transducer TonB [Novosphingobium sp. BL-8A]|uniref:energy transducer TonB n=1 Tax=Novosphingobium sp. BL-8A TaxID=3127639 RepID=UPI003757BF0C